MNEKKISTVAQMEAANQAFLKKYLNELRKYDNFEYNIDCDFKADKLNYLHAVSVVRRTDANPAMTMREQMQKVLTAMWSIKVRFQLIMHFDGAALKIYIGTENNYGRELDALRSILESSIAGVEFENKDGCTVEYVFRDIAPQYFTHCGVFAGNPVVRELNQQMNDICPIDDIIMGSTNIPWMICISAVPVDEGELWKAYNNRLYDLTEVSECVNASYSFSAAGTGVAMNTQKIYSGAERYHGYISAICNTYEEATQCGQWQTAMICFSDSRLNVDLFGGMFSALMKSGHENMKRPISFRYYYQRQIKGLTDAFQTGSPSSSVLLSSRELSEICSLPVRDSFGFQVTERADFDVHRHTDSTMKMCIGNIVNGNRITHAEYRLDLNTLNRHGLVIGLTGGGKTNTVKSLLHNIAEQGCPFMVIEPAKQEYFELYRMGRLMSDLQVYSVGAIEGNILKINPFEVVRTSDGRNVSIQTHIDAVFAAFKASFIMYTPMPYVLENAIYEIYRDYGWDVETGKNHFGVWEFPTIEDLYYKIEPVVKDMGYDEKMQNDLIGSLKARINSLRVGAKGRTLNVAQSIPMEKLLSGKVIIELDDVGDEDAKAFIIGLLMMQIQECRKMQDTTQLELRHMLLIEEAHRLLKNVSSGSGENADPRGNAVEYFCNMLAELRSKGQGFLVIDQIPSKLAPDLVKNTNLKIIHRTVAMEDRELMGGAMNMDENQQKYLACLRQGFAAVYSEGDNHPKLVKLPYAGQFEEQRLKTLGHREIVLRTAVNCQKQTDDERFTNQTHCNAICRHCRKCSRWNEPDKQVKKVMADKADEALKQIREKNLADALFWLHDDLPKLMQLDKEGHHALEQCLLADWLNHYMCQMDYSLYARLSSEILEILSY